MAVRIEWIVGAAMNDVGSLVLDQIVPEVTEFVCFDACSV